LRGKVIATVNRKHLEPGDCFILLSLYGKEKVQKASLSKNNCEYQLFLVNLKLQHPEWRTRIRMTTYVLPFAIPLPSSLPSTSRFTYDSDGDMWSRIQYKVQIMAGPQGAKVSTYVHVTSAPLPEEHVPCTVGPQSFPLCRYGFLARGSFVMAAHVEDTYVGKGQNLYLHLACQNNSPLRVRNVRITLLEHSYYDTSANVVAKAFEASRPHFTQTLLTVTLDQDHLSELVPIGKVSSSNNTEDQETYQRLHEEVVSGGHPISILVPNFIRDDYDGRIIKVTHSLLISIRTPFTTTRPDISIPIHIGTSAVYALAPMATVSSHVPSAASSRPPPVHIPEAVAIPDDASVSNVVYATGDVIFLGDDAMSQVPYVIGDK